MKYWFCLICLGFFSSHCFSQGFDRQISSGTVDVDGESIKGYQTHFDFNADRVEKGLWKFSHAFAKTTDLRTHHEISIPVEKSNQSIQLVAQVVNLDGKSCLFKLSAKDSSPEQVRSQLKDFIVQFKRYFYLEYYQQEIDLLEARAAGEAKNYLRSLEVPGGNSNAHMNTLQEIHQEIEALRHQQREVVRN